MLIQPSRMVWKTKTLIIKRYEIYYADLNPTIGNEIKKISLVIIISQDEMNKYIETVVVCPLTLKLHPQWRTRLQIKCANKKAEIAVDQIRTISKQRLKKKIDTLSKNNAAQLRKLITDMYGE
jgi:mRNA interferase MazF